jgi:hypothetical protein
VGAAARGFGPPPGTLEYTPGYPEIATSNALRSERVWQADLRVKERRSRVDRDELEEQNGEQLPDREVMSVISPGADGIATIAPVEPEGL